VCYNVLGKSDILSVAICHAVPVIATGWIVIVIVSMAKDR